MISSPPVSFHELYAGVEPMLKRSPCLKEFSDLESHLRWYWNHGTMSWAQDGEGKFTGICLIKLLTDLTELDQWYVHDPDGQFLLIEEVVSDSPATWQKLFDQLFGIWGARKYMLWDRRERTEKKCPRIYTWEQYLKILRRLTH